MQVSRSIICASIKTALATPSMRPASSSKSCVSMVSLSFDLASLLARQNKPTRSSPAICLEVVLPRAWRAFQ